MEPMSSEEEQEMSDLRRGIFFLLLCVEVEEECLLVDFVS